MGLSSETRFGFGYMVRLWAFGLYVRESIANTGMRDSFGIVQLSGKSGEKRKYCKSTGKSWKPGGGKVIVFLLVGRGCSRGKRLTWGNGVPRGWI